MDINTEYKAGSNCSGSDGGTNRVLTLDNNQKTIQNGFLVFRGGISLKLADEYTVSHNDANTTITFLIPVWNDQSLIIQYQFGTAPSGSTALRQRLNEAFAKLITRAGRQLRINYYTQTIGSVYDDNATLAVSGTSLWTSGIVLPIDASTGNYDSILVQQGKLIDGDKRLYLAGSLALTGSKLMVKIGLGSPIAEEFAPLDFIGGAEAQGQVIYKKLYIRQLKNGSYIGE